MTVVRVPPKLFRRGVELDSLGLDDRAWKPVDALMLISMLRSANVAVLGGDVYVADNGDVERTIENWYCDAKASETLDDFVQRSCAEATHYIRQLQYSKMPNPLVTLVISGSFLEGKIGAFE